MVAQAMADFKADFVALAISCLLWRPFLLFCRLVRTICFGFSAFDNPAFHLEKALWSTLQIGLKSSAFPRLLLGGSSGFELCLLFRPLLRGL